MTRTAPEWNRVGYGLLLLYLVIAFPLRNHQVFVDEGSNLNLAACVLKGLHLYRDLFENHFPFPVYLSAGLIYFTGASLPLVRLAVLLIDAAMFVAVMRVSRLTFAIGFAAAVWAFVSPYYFGNLLLYDNLAMMGGLALGAVCFAALTRGLPASRGMFVLLAVAGFVSTMSNPFFALVTVIALGALSFAPGIPRTFVVKVVITIAVPIAAYFAYLAATGALGYFYAYTIVFNTTTYPKYATISILPLITHQLLLLDIFNPHWRVSWDPLRFNPIAFSPIFDYWVFSGLFYRVDALLACLLFGLRRDYRTAAFVYVFTAALPLRGDELFHAAPFVLFCFFLAGILIQEAVSLAPPWKVMILTVCGVPTVLLVFSGARYVSQHAFQSDFDALIAEADLIRQAAQSHSDVRLGHYPDGNYMYYLTGFRPVSKFVDFYPWVAEIGRSEEDSNLARTPSVVLVMDISNSVWRYRNYDTLRSEIAYANKYLVKEKVGSLTVFVSPPLALPGGRGTEAPLTALAAPLGSAPVEIAGGWTKNGYYKGPNGPAAPSTEGLVYGSFPDANTGSIRLGPFHLDGKTEIAIPLVTGPDTHNLSVVLRDAVSKKLLSKMDPPAVHTTWWAWQPELPMGGEITVEVFAEDKGSGWGQWLAVGWPHVLRPRKTGPLCEPGLYRNGEWRLVTDIENVSGPGTRVYRFGGKPDDLPVTGDWNGSGRTKIGIYRASLGQWILDYNGNGVSDAGDKTYHFGGQSGDLPVTGDWDGSGKTKIGIYRPSTGEWLLDYNGDGVFNPAQDRTYRLGGEAGDRPLTGDWTGSGTSKIGIVRRDYHWFLDTNGDGKFEGGVDASFFLGGLAGDIPVTGDWNGDGRSKPGIVRGSSWLFDLDGNYQLDDASSSRNASVEFGSPGDKPVTGAW
jgi:hypothetical protein